MPRSISEIRKTTSIKNLSNLQKDPAKNSTMGNVKLLYDFLAEYTGDLAVDKLREELADIMLSFEGKLDEKSIKIVPDLLYAPLHLVYLMHANQNTAVGIKDEKKRLELKNLLEYVAEGFNVGEGFEISEEQKNNVRKMEAVGLAEQEEEERLERKNAFESKSGLNHLDEYKASISALPKSFDGETQLREAIARQQLKGFCMDIMATRRAIDAKRNDKSGLANATANVELFDSIRKDMVKSEAVNGFLDSMSYRDLRKLAAEGHGGAMEERFQKYLREDAAEIPKDAPQQYMPTALERLDALKKKMGTGDFQRKATPGEQRKVYIELLATRAAVGAKRNAKSSLNPKVSGEILDRERQKFKEEPLRSALVNVTFMGDRQKAAWKAATTGHGGGLEDLLRTEIRRMATAKDNGYRMQNVDSRFAPTYGERQKDLRAMLDFYSMSTREKFRAAVEMRAVEQAMEQVSLKGDDRITNIESINRQTETQVALYSKVLDEAGMQQFIDNAKARGYEEAFKTVEADHAGELKAIRLSEKLDEKLAGDPEKADLPKLAAQRMILLQYRQQFQSDKDNTKLEDAIDKNLDKDVEKLMNHYLFKEVCEKLGTRGLLEQAKGNGEQLVESFALAQQDKLQPYGEEKAPAAVKDDLQKNIVNEGPEQPKQLI